MIYSPRGSLWSRWDLHVHTPATLANNQYGGDSPEAWERFFRDIESLPPAFKVLGINDYIFLDGYKRVVAAHEQGRMQNIALFLPVVELRLAAFGGSRTKLSRVNFHVIFSDQIGAEVIESQFLNGLSRHYQITPRYEPAARNKRWQALPTRESLRDLGSLIIESVPAGQRPRFDSPLQEGFNNINFDLADVLRLLDSHYFTNRYLTSVGKTEWEDVKWDTSTIADKKHIISNADLVFISAEDPGAWERAIRSLRNAEVNPRLLDCSDAHRFSDSTEKDRLGNCFTWIKADTSFEGLQHALKEFDERIYTGFEPPLLRRVRESASRFVDRVEIRRRTDVPRSVGWFDNEVELNPGLVAVIGNKGSGKSALAEVVGVVGNTRKQQHFSFLSPNKFRQPGPANLASKFVGTLHWGDGTTQARRLDSALDPNEPERIQFIPQNFLEGICNEVQQGDLTDFDRELARVIFAHVDQTDRLGQDTLENLIAVKTRAAEGALDALRRDLHGVNSRIIELEHRGSENYRRSLETKLGDLRRALADLRRGRPAVVDEPVGNGGQSEGAKALEDALTEQAALVEATDVARSDLDRLNRALSVLENFSTAIETFRLTVNRLEGEYSAALEPLGVDFSEVVVLRIDGAPLDAARTRLQSERQLRLAELDPAADSALPARAVAVAETIRQLQAQLDAPARAYREYLAALEGWRRRRTELIGGPDTAGSACYYRAQLRALQDLPGELSRLREERLRIAKQIHARLSALVEEARSLYRPIQAFVDRHEVSADVALRFAAGLVDRGFETEFFDFVDRRSAVAFAGDQAGVVRDLLARTDLNDAEQVLALADSVHNRLHTSVRGGAPAGLQGLLRKGRDAAALYNFLYGFEYLEPRYTLKFGEKGLHELSPGEKGTLLLIFYLLIDPSDVPLVIDQPEDNLDNQTVVRVLVPCVREARRRRQIFLVTHNPNLAVVCDADQVIAASIEKERDNRVSYETGALENPAINRRVVDILEGTWPAFDNRGQKYRTHMV